MAKKAKKAAAKTVSKPAVSTPKAHVEIHYAEKSLGHAPKEYHFVLHDGRKLGTVYQLIDELETMPEETFRHHVTGFKNDFANWLNDIFKEHDLAGEMKGIQDRVETQRAILKHLVKELRKAKPEKERIECEHCQ